MTKIPIGIRGWKSSVLCFDLFLLFVFSVIFHSGVVGD